MTVGSSLAVSTSRTAATSSISPGPCAPVASPVSPQLGNAGASLATARSASSLAVRCHHHDPSFTHAPCTKTTLTDNLLVLSDQLSANNRRTDRYVKRWRHGKAPSTGDQAA